MTVNSITRECPVCGGRIEVPIPDPENLNDGEEDSDGEP